MIHGVFEPPSGRVAAAIGRHKLLICALGLIAALVAAAYAHTRPRTYTASATLQVGQVNPNSPGFYSYVESASALATAFSRAISAAPVLAAVQHKLDLPPAKTVTRLSAEPLPQSPAFRVFAEGPTEAGTVNLANVAANAIIAYEGQSNSSNPEAESLLQEYQKASLQLQGLTTNLERLTARGHETRASKSSLAQTLAPVKAETAVATARLAAIRDAYTAAVTSQAPRSGLVSLLAGATSAGSDRRSKVELFGFIGLLVGLAIGCATAVALDRRRAHQPLRVGVAGEVQRSTEPA